MKKSLCDCGCQFEIGGELFVKKHVDYNELEKLQILKDESERQEISRDELDAQS